MKSKLAKMEMPKKRKDEMSLESPEMEMEMESPEMEGEDMAAEGEDMGMEEASSPELEKLSDDELLAEIKKRGLMSQLESSPEGEEENKEPDYFA